MSFATKPDDFTWISREKAALCPAVSGRIRETWEDTNKLPGYCYSCNLGEYTEQKEYPNHAGEKSSGLRCCRSDLGCYVRLPGGGGGMAGRKANKKLKTAMVDKLFLGLIAVIIGISCYNAWRFLK